MSTLNKTHDGEEATRRDFLHIAAAGGAGVGAAIAVWPFVDQMNPAADTLALATVEVDISHIAEGEAIVIKWRGKPIFIRHRTAAEIEAARTVDMSVLVDKQADTDRVEKDDWLVVVGTCTHLGCVPLGSKSGDDRGDFGGWFCPCHGSHYDTSGRIRKGPAPKNLAVPEYAFMSDTTIKIG
ncbi:ubiquinol-cytochrome c reductase iron-sulfur subunit [Kordiimonas pumila]|uniref:Ubiquinol-cytochrome c reductase iron-sulfur subunit n=1 Tax=Kordiimonas pumila TaxID=2161677 RepID=A0ABV7D889_9PROT|nr:ubiquinol-cytochrome c reductase iron-sulfur subunit [Kordiimonas pumila]